MAEPGVTEVICELPPASTAKERAEKFDRIAAHVRRLPQSFKAEHPNRVLTAIIRIVDLTGPLADTGPIDLRLHRRVRAYGEIETVVLDYLPPGGGTPAQALRKIESIIDAVHAAA